MTKQTSQPRAGFTLIELLVVLAIVSLLVALGIPAFNALTGSRSVEAGRNVVAAALGQARTVAVNEGKYAGVMFYVDPATERTAMSVIVVNDPVSSLDDPDPYDKYKGWVIDQEYMAGKVDASSNNITRADRVIAFSADADATFKGDQYAKTPLVSEYLKYFGNYRPTVRSFRCVEQHTSAYSVSQRPPQNGPYGNYSGSATPPSRYFWGGSSMSNGGAPSAASTKSPFGNQYWGEDSQKDATRYVAGQQTLLPTGVGLQVTIPPTSRTGSNFQERYVRTGVILFDPQGRLVLRNISLSADDTLGQYLGFQQNAQNIVSGVGIVLYDRRAFRDVALADGSHPTESDFLYQVVNGGNGNLYSINSTFASLFADQNAATFNDEQEEETWLDNNATQLLINRYSGSLSETE